VTKLIALCGAPQSGKTEVQKHLVEHYGAVAVDDGWPLRDFAIRHFGLSNWHVNTQAGKASFVKVPGGRLMRVRDILGEIGNKIEEAFGADAIPEMALQRATAQNVGLLVFGSVRRQQGAFYKRHGATVIEIIRPGYPVVNEFDQYDKSVVDRTIINNHTLGQLHQKVDLVMGALGLPRVPTSPQ
jgi:hypothetical protein